MKDMLADIFGTLTGAGSVAAVFGALVTSWFAFQFERHKRGQAQQLEAIKADLSLVTRLRGSAEERRSEAAAKVLISCLQLLDFLRSVTSPGYSSKPGSETFEKEIGARWSAGQESMSEFTKHWVLAETYLAFEVCDLLERISKLRCDIQTAQSMLFGASLQGGPVDKTDLKAGFGDETRKMVAALRDEAKAILRPVAQIGLSGVPCGLPNSPSEPDRSRESRLLNGDGDDGRAARGLARKLPP